MTYRRKVEQISTPDEVAAFIEGNEDYKFAGTFTLPSPISERPLTFVVLEMEST